MLSVHMTWLLNGSEAVGYLALMQTSMVFMDSSLHHNNST